MKHKVAITIEIDLDTLTSATDEWLAAAWTIAQWNPAPMGDPEAGNLADRIGCEIIRRWLGKAPVEMYQHSKEQAYWLELTKHCICVDGQWL